MSAIISTVTAQNWGLLNQPEMQSFQKMYDEDLLSEGIVFFPAALENYYAKLGMSKTEFSFMRNLLQLWARNDKKSWFVQDQIEELFGKSRRQVQRDARKLAKEGFIIITEWDDLHNEGVHCIHYDCTPFLQMISQLVRVNRQRNTYKEDSSTEKKEDTATTYNIVPVQELSLTALTNRFFEKRHAEEALSLSVATPSDTDQEEAAVTHVAIRGSHIHMPRGKRLPHTSFADMYDPAYAVPETSEPPNKHNMPQSQQNVPTQTLYGEPITEPRLAAHTAHNTQSASVPPQKMAQTHSSSAHFRAEDSQRKPHPKQINSPHPALQRPSTSYQSAEIDLPKKPAQRAPIQAITQQERDLARQKNQQPTRLPLLSSVIMREVSQALRDRTPHLSQREAAIIFRRLLLINRVQDDLAIKHPDQHFSNLIKGVFQHLLAISKQRPEISVGNETMENFMTELNHAAFEQFEQIKVLRHQRTDKHRRTQREIEVHTSPQAQPIQLAEPGTAPQFDQNSRAVTTATNYTQVPSRARNFPVGEELVALAQHMHISMTEEEANDIEIGTASEQLLIDIQDAILLSYDQQPDIVANVNYA